MSTNENMTIEQIAKVAHEANRAYCQTQKDYTQKPWDLAPEWIKESARDGVRFCQVDPSITPEHIHQQWCANRVKAGWVYGAVKDWKKKVHPCLVPYAELSVEQHRKDWLFVAVVMALLP